MHHVFEFGAWESCGECTPCRLGSRYIEQTFRKVLENGRTALKDRSELDEVVKALAMTSLCGHGSGLAEFARSVSRYYGKELQSCFA
jgi:NADH:ubiquinone oxidoreductase subunit F (NADH-binding)